MSIKGYEVISIINKIADVINENKIYLTELDAAIGDGDHGLNMSKGFEAVKEKLKDDNGDDLGNTFKKVGMTLVSTVGGASGPLYGTAFMKGASVLNGKSEIDLDDYIQVLKASLDGIKMRGKAELGEKTMIDCLEPYLNELIKVKSSGLDVVECLNKAKEAAFKGLEKTKEIKATKGRASYLGDRSIGHQDAGATSTYLMLKTVYTYIKGE
ncbi:dihydroxyacetone kinase subunit DhaL [Romboutsia sp. 1001713B170207_170306_H8]|uniref:dihydroxyacetone kinase subunit DhaL n=1 Tax=Romboutsia sp. 1001713B170207_170306_H8 TaxID=2787112 RepID=UPI0008216C6C|nr:dihydroxyacetone kinase subunit DhaL [Romboutsia sp. 1001713B170207_170306_H8]SCH62061.1 PTS-dependent dihydroxyacetone kinase%2C ADP-binding subunit dhaL [uncultured Clostridium sp.]